MSPEIVSALIGLIGVILGIIPTYLFMRQKGSAEVDRIKAEADKMKAEAEKIRAEIPKPPLVENLSSVASVDVVKNKEVGLVNIGNARSAIERTAYYQKVLNLAAEGSEVIIVGRSLIDWSQLYKSIEDVIFSKKLVIKLGLLDINSISRDTGTSWIEKPIIVDSAIDDVTSSMEHFKRIRVKPDTGSLEIYGLPFYVLNNYVSYTSCEDNVRYCLEEVGKALDKEDSPFLEFKATSHNCVLSSFETIYKSFFTQERLILSDHGTRNERNTERIEMLIAPKVKKYGLSALSVGSKDIDWTNAKFSIEEKIRDTPDGGEIFLVGRSLISWTHHNSHDTLVEAITCRGLKCTFVMADPTKPELKSLVKGDYAEKDVPVAWEKFSKVLQPYLTDKYAKASAHGEQRGFFKLYGIPAYIPESFSAYTSKSGVQYCVLEVGIGVVSTERATFVFKKSSDNDIYSKLYAIYRSLLVNRYPLIQVPNDFNTGSTLQSSLENS